MSFEVYLLDKKGKPVQVDTHAEGGNIKLDKPFTVGNTVMIGNQDAELNITFNYSKYYYQTINSKHGLRYLHHMKARKAIPILRTAIKKLGTSRTGSYWSASPENAGHALATLLTWAEQYPNATFVVH